MNDPVFKTRWLVTLADRDIYYEGADYMRERTQTAEVLNQAWQTARTIPGDESQTVTVRGGESPLIVDDDQDRGSFLMAIALRYAQIGQSSQAQEVAQTLENATLRQQFIQQINCYRVEL